LENEQIPTPINYQRSKSMKRGGRSYKGSTSRWNGSTITNMLKLREYCGDVVNFKTHKPSYKSKKQYSKPPEEWMVFENVHTPIIDRATWEKVQAKRGTVRKRRKKSGERNLFCGLLKCADCGTNLAYHKNAVSGIEYFNCQEFNRKPRACDASHYIRVDFLEQIVLKEIQRLTKFAGKYEDAFVQAVVGFSKDAEQFERKRGQKELDRLKSRNAEIDSIVQKLYEDKVKGVFSEDRFIKMTASYEKEQSELAVAADKLESSLARETRKANTIDSFIRTVRQYTRARKLTAQMLNELVGRIEVHQADKINGVYEQKVVIYYHCIGSIEIPDMIPDVRIDMNTRKGVNISYTTSKRAGCKLTSKAEKTCGGGKSRKKTEYPRKRR
jgi:hypothetical protein